MPTRTHPILVLIGGSSGSGKTTLANALQSSFASAKSQIISTDSYYRPTSHLSMEERAILNYDHPDQIDFDLLVQQLHELIAGRTITVPGYNMKSHDRDLAGEIVTPKEVLIIEGIFALYDDRLCSLAHTCIFVATPSELCFTRRLERDVRERGRTAESVHQQWQTTVSPMTSEFCLPTASRAHMIIPGNTTFDSVLPTIFEKLSNLRQ